MDHQIQTSMAASERTPLVGNSAGSASPSPSPTGGPKPRRRRASAVSSVLSGVAIPSVHRPDTIVYFLCGIVLIGTSSSGFWSLATTRIFEDVVCRRYYDEAHRRGAGTATATSAAPPPPPVDEAMCKVDAVQSQLAFLIAVQSSIGSAVMMVAAIPWALVADRIGRKRMIALAIIGMATSCAWTMVVGWFQDSLPVRLIWLAPLAYLCGAGEPILSASIYSMITDVMPESGRSKSFMRFSASAMLGNLLSPALASAMMSAVGPWSCMLLGILLLVFSAALVVFLMPETLQRKPAGDDGEPQEEALGLRDYIAQGLAQVRDSASMLRSRAVVLVLCTELLELPLIVCTYQFLVQFVSRRYGVPIAQTGYVQSAYGLAQIAVVLLLLPAVSWLMLRASTPAALRVAGASAQRRDLVLARWCYGACAAGALVLGAAPTLAAFVAGLLVLALGSSAAGNFLRAVATLHVDQAHRSRFFTARSLAARVSDLWSAPALAGLFSLGMRLGGIWIGLPYFGVSVLCVAMLVIAMFVHLPASSASDVECSSDDESGSDTGQET
ncbi:MFS general substrate transporter [Xylariaceae sp. FL0804]|nr:MFS general substrate transporter [Xylariaceae sp. FL0804]